MHFALSLKNIYNAFAYQYSFAVSFQTFAPDPKAFLKVESVALHCAWWNELSPLSYKITSAACTCALLERCIWMGHVLEFTYQRWESACERGIFKASRHIIITLCEFFNFPASAGSTTYFAPRVWWNALSTPGSNKPQTLAAWLFMCVRTENFNLCTDEVDANFAPTRKTRQREMQFSAEDLPGDKLGNMPPHKLYYCDIQERALLSICSNKRAKWRGGDLFTISNVAEMIYGWIFLNGFDSLDF